MLCCLNSSVVKLVWNLPWKASPQAELFVRLLVPLFYKYGSFSQYVKNGVFSFKIYVSTESRSSEMYIVIVDTWNPSFKPWNNGRTSPVEECILSIISSFTAGNYTQKHSSQVMYDRYFKACSFLNNPLRLIST